jgi:ferric-dicitrate binding protein FerR (iron transport regulator)
VSPQEREKAARVKADQALVEYLILQRSQEFSEEQKQDAWTDFRHAHHDHAAALAVLGRRGVA